MRRLIERRVKKKCTKKHWNKTVERQRFMFPSIMFVFFSVHFVPFQVVVQLFNFFFRKVCTFIASNVHWNYFFFSVCFVVHYIRHQDKIINFHVDIWRIIKFVVVISLAYAIFVLCNSYARSFYAINSRDSLPLYRYKFQVR